jgi:hypothetical protein
MWLWTQVFGYLVVCDVWFSGLAWSSPDPSVTFTLVLCFHMFFVCFIVRWHFCQILKQNV